MNNGKISLRQYKRLLFFDIMGPGLVLLPQLLAGLVQTAGVVAVLLGALLANVYILLVTRTTTTGIRQHSWLYVVYGIYFLVAGGYGLYLLADLVHTFLLRSESFLLITVMLVLLLLYSRRAGLEGRARTFEVLFWPLVVLLVILFAIGSKGMQLTNLLPVTLLQGNMAAAAGVSFLVFGAVQLIFFMAESLEDGVTLHRLQRGTSQMIWISAVFLLFVYEMLLGSFGADALAAARTPIMIFTSNIAIPGGFLRRQEALVAGICFAGLLAFSGSGLHYGSFCMEKLCHEKQKKGMVWLSAGVMLFLCLWQYGYAGTTDGLAYVLTWGTPVALLLPFLLSANKKTLRACGAMALLCSLLLGSTGCSVRELENKSFPMIMSLGEEDGECMLSYQYMDLSRVSEKEKTKQGSDELRVVDPSVTGALQKIDQKSGKVIDLNHVKVLLLEASFLENGSLMEQLVEKGNSGIELPGNMLVFVVDDTDTIGRLQEHMDEDLGSYLEELIEGNPNYDDTNGATFKSLICDWYNGNGNTILPYLAVQNDLPVVDGYYLVQSGKGGSNYTLHKVTEEKGLVAGLCSGTVGAMEIDVDEGQIHLEDVRAYYEFSRSNSALLCQVTFRGNIMAKDSVDASEEWLIEQAEAYLAGEIYNAWTKEHVDLTNSLCHLRCHDSDLCEEYLSDAIHFEEDLKLSVDCHFRVIQ